MAAPDSIQRLSPGNVEALAAADRLRHRRLGLHRFVLKHTVLFQTYPALHQLLPAPENTTCSKRAWEDLFVVRAILRYVDDCDRIAAHNFVLHRFDCLLHHRHDLREALPDPAEDEVPDNEWAEAFIAAVDLILQTVSDA